LKSGFWQIQIHKDDKYKTVFTTPFGHYEWNVMPFGLKNAPSEFQNIMNDIFNPFSKFCIVYIDDVLIFSKSIDEHWKHLNSFLDIIKRNGLVVSSPKIKLFQTKIRFLGYNIYQGKIVWNKAQNNYSTIKKEILSIVLCIDKFQTDLVNQKFFIHIDCKSAKYVLEKDVENIASKHIFARWQSILSIFYFEIEYIKGSQNFIPDFLTRELLQNKDGG
jgi:hypothetical protein